MVSPAQVNVPLWILFTGTGVREAKQPGRRLLAADRTAGCRPARAGLIRPLAYGDPQSWDYRPSIGTRMALSSEAQSMQR
jgi:hypothetical protein